jgi:hypothetical protein
LPLARVGVAAVGATAFVLSYGALHELALGARIDPRLAWLWPVAVDVLAIVSAIAARVFHGGRWSAAYAWLVLIMFLGLSVWGNGLHAVAGRAPGQAVVLVLDPWQRVVVSATPPVALALALHLMLMMGARYGPPPPVPGNPQPVRDRHAPVPDNGDSTQPTLHAATPNGTGEPGGNPTLPPPGTPSGRLAPAFLAPVPDRAEPVRDNRDGGPPAYATGDDEEMPPDPDPLLPLARDLSRTGSTLSRTALIAGLRDAGHACGTERARRLLATLAAERDALSGTGAPSVPDSLAGRNGAGP